MAGKLNKFIKVIDTYKQFFLNHMSHRIHATALPEHPLHDDLYIVSFPKSGTTWLNFLMANIHLKMSGSNQAVTFYNINDFIPDILQFRSLKETILPFPGHRVIKSHAEFNPLYKKVLYLVRDPRDVMISYFWFLKNLGEFQEGLSHLVRSPVYGIEAWCRHVKGWVEQTPASTSIEFLRYEDLKKDAGGVLTRIYTLLGHQIPPDILEQALQLSSFENMKKLEQYYNYGGDFRFPGLEFVRKGQSGAFTAELAARDLDFINQQAAPWLAMFGYSP